MPQRLPAIEARRNRRLRRRFIAASAAVVLTISDDAAFARARTAARAGTRQQAGRATAGGTISVDSEPGRGATFRVHLPAVRPAGGRRGGGPAPG